MISFLAYLQSGPVPQAGAESWEISKGVMLTLSTLGVGYLVRTVRSLEVSLRLLQVDVKGEDGHNGIKSETKKHSHRIEAIEKRNARIDALAEKERQQYGGPERRQTARRERDIEFPNPLDDSEIT